jgi:hypothetical protein
MHRLFQFNLRTLFLLVLCCAVALTLWATYIQPYYHERRLVAELSRSEQFAATTEAVGSKSFKWLAGDTFAQRVKQVEIGSGFTDGELAKLRQFSNLKAVAILDGSSITDDGLAHLAHVTTLEDLMLGHSANSEQGLSVLSRLPILSDLSITTTDRGLQYVGELRELRRLTVWGDVSDKGVRHLMQLSKLESLRCYSPRMNKLTFTLTNPTMVEFVETPLADAIDFLASFHNVQIRFDTSELEANDFHVAKFTVTLTHQGELRDSLRLMLAPHSLEFTMEPGGIVITTGQAAKTRRQGLEELRRKLPNLKEVDVWWAPLER